MFDASVAKARKAIEDAEKHLDRLSATIEEHARLGLDTADSWRRFRLATAVLENMRISDSLLHGLRRIDQGNRPAVPAAVAAGPQRNLMSFKAGSVIAPSAPPLNLYLLEAGIVSLCLPDRGGIEVSMIGPGGTVGLSALLAPELARVTAVAVTPCHAVPIPFDEFANRMYADSDGLRFLHWNIAQQLLETQILARCNAQHAVRERIARWILSGARHVGGFIGPISHDRLAVLLGVRRASVTVAFHELEGEGAIRSLRNFIEIRDQSVLERFSCECSALLVEVASGQSHSAALSMSHAAHLSDHQSDHRRGQE